MFLKVRGLSAPTHLYKQHLHFQCVQDTHSHRKLPKRASCRVRRKDCIFWELKIKTVSLNLFYQKRAEERDFKVHTSLLGFEYYLYYLTNDLTCKMMHICEWSVRLLNSFLNIFISVSWTTRCISSSWPWTKSARIIFVHFSLKIALDYQRKKS